MEIDDALIEEIKEIANHKKVIKHLEPNIMVSFPIKGWMVRRVLYSYFLFQTERAKDEIR